jgi:hypothetical protein
MTYRFAVLVAFASTFAAAPAGAQDPLAARLLSAHNQERLAVGHAPLQWDERLASDAAAYAAVLASIRRLIHSPRETRMGQSENLAMASHGSLTPEQLVDLWSREKRLMSGTLFPAVSRTGNWADVGHYTQMVWPTTTRVGCAIHPGAMDVLVCRYSPKGNIDGKPVFAASTMASR